MARVSGANKMGFAEGYKQYNPAKQGYGTPAMWRSLFSVRMSSADAQAHKASRGGWVNDWTVVGDAAGVHIDENSMWSEVKKAFRAAAMKCHPDRCTQHGMTNDEALEKFKDVSAAYAMLEDIYTSQNRLT